MGDAGPLLLEELEEVLAVRSGKGCAGRCGGGAYCHVVIGRGWLVKARHSSSAERLPTQFFLDDMPHAVEFARILA